MALGARLRRMTAPLARPLRHAVRPRSEAMRAGLELGEDSPLHLDWIVGAMAFLAALAMVGALATMDAAAHWRRGLTGTLTVEIPAPLKAPQAAPAAAADATAQLDRVLAILRNEPGIERATPLPRARIAELLSPWLGTGDLIDSLPVPQLIDVRLASDARLDVAGLKQRLAAAAAGTTLDDHQIWIAQLVHLARLAVGLALTIVGLVAASAVAAVVIATRAGLAMHHEAIDLLHLMGAEDDYIADQFASQALRRGLRGGVLGLLLAALALVGFGIASQAVDPKLLPRLWPALDQVLPLVLVPLATAGLGWATARHTVRRALKQMV
jgi:cell division transport system permease protein